MYLQYKKSDRDKAEIVGFSDADWASDVDDRKSVTGYVFTMGGAAITWNTRKQQTVALSTTEAEYMALSSATQEAVWLQKLHAELVAYKPLQIFCDNRGAICLTTSDVFHPRTKHIDIRHHFVRERVDSGDIIIKPISTDQMTADIMTKALPREKHSIHTQSMCLCN